MSLGDKFRKHGFFGRLIYYPLMAGLIAVSGCNKGDSGPSGPVGGGNGGGNGGHIEDSGRTNNDGELKLEVDGQEFDVHVTSENGDNLEDIVVTGDYFGNNIYGFSFEDFNHTYFSSVQYVDINRTSSIDEANGFRINEELNKLRGREYEKRFHDRDEPYPYDLSQNPGLRFKKTIAIDGLHDFYVENDAIFQNIILLEFMTSLTGSPELSFALEAAKFRQTFIEKLNNYNDLINSVASLFGGSFEKEAYYVDVYENDLRVLTHQTTTKGNYITLKGNVYNNDNSNRISSAFIDITRGPVFKSAYSDNNGKYFIKFLTEGLYGFTASHSGFNNDNKEKHLSFNGYTQPRCNTLDFRLTPESRETTLILQPGPEGKDAMLACWMEISSRGDTLFNYINENYKDDPMFNVMYLDYFQRNDHIINKRNFLIKFDDLPNNPNFYNATLFIHGFSSNFYESVTIEVRRVTQSWDENTVNWTNQPIYNSYIYDFGITPMNPNRGWVSFDLTDLAKGWINGNYPNHGVILSASFDHEGIYNGKTSDYTDSFSERPKLAFVYRN